MQEHPTPLINEESKAEQGGGCGPGRKNRDKSVLKQRKRWNG